MRDILSPLEGLGSPLKRRASRSIAGLLMAGASALVVFDPSQVANLNWQRNFALGSALVTDSTYWQQSAFSNFGVTTTPIGSGIDPVDGLPYYDFRSVGTPTATSVGFIYVNAANAANAVTPGQTYTVSIIGQMIAGSLPVGSGLRTYIQGRDASNTIVETSASIDFRGTTEAVVSVSRTFSNPNVVRVEAFPYLNVQVGVPVDVSFRVKGLQLERGSARTEYQPITELGRETRARFPNATLFQDLTGATPVCAPGQSTRLMLDVGRDLVLGPELITNGEFTAGTTGWTGSSASLSVVAGSLRVLSTVTGVSARLADQVVTGLTVGRTYVVTAVAKGSGGPGNKAARLEIRNGGSSLAFGNIVYNPIEPTSLKVVFTATAAQHNIWLRFDGPAASDTTSYVDFDEVSFRELPGAHATQSTDGSRPIYAQVPASGIRNVAHGSADVAGTTTYGLAPTWQGITYTKVAQGINEAGLPFVRYSVTGTAAATSALTLQFFSNWRTPALPGQTWTFSAFTRVVSGTIPAGAAYRLEAVGETSANASTANFVNGPNISHTTSTLSSVSVTLSDATTAQIRPGLVVSFTAGQVLNFEVEAAGVQLEMGASRSAFQFNYARHHIVEPPFAQLHALLFDGVDDFMVTPTVDPAAGCVAFGPELVSNGDFSNGTTGWAAQNGGTLSVVSNALRITEDGVDGSVARATQVITTVVGKTYLLTATLAAGSAGGNIALSPNSSFNGQPQRTLTAGQTGTVAFVATSATTNVILAVGATTAGTTADFDNVSVREATGKPDSVQVFAGVRKLSDTASGIVAELTAASGANPGAFAVFAPGAASPTYLWRSRGSAISDALSAASFPAPDTAVLTGIGDISADSAILRHNGTQIASAATDQGTGNFTAAQIFIGRRGGTSLPFMGYYFGSAIRFGPNLSEGVIRDVEREYSAKCGVAA